MSAEAEVVLPSPSLIVLAGPPASGKSTWAQQHFPGAVVSSDELRALAGEGTGDLRASAAALDFVDQVVAERMRRRLTTVVDTLGTDADARARWREAADAAGVPAHVVLCDVTAASARELNRSRDKRVPEDVLRNALRSWPEQRSAIVGEGWTTILEHRVDAPVRARTAASDIATATAKQAAAT